MAIPFETFGDSVEAHLHYAIGLDGEELAEVVSRRLHDKSWRRASYAFVSALEWLGHRKPSGAPAVFADLADVLVAEGLDSDCRLILRQVLHAGSWAEPEQRKLATWFARVADIGDAAYGADLLEHKTPEELRPLHLIASWLLDRSGTELLAGRRLRLLFTLVEMMVDASDLERTATAIRYLLDNERMFESGSFSQAQLHTLGLALDLVLDQSLAKPEILVDVARKLPEREAGEELASLATRARRPALHPALLELLSEARFRRTDAVAAWRVVVSREEPSSGMSLVRNAAIDLCDALLSRIHDPAPASTRAAWSYLVTRELLRHADRRLAASDIAALSRLIGTHAEVDDAIGRALEDGDAVVGEPRLMAALLAIRNSHTVRGALALVLPPDVEPETSQWTQTIEEEITSWVIKALASEATPLTGWVCRVERIDWTKLESENSLELRDGDLMINRDDVVRLTAARLTNDELVAAGALYVVHELIHRFQQIGGPAVVRVVRAAHAETTLMHLDLGADHWAAVLLSHVWAPWDLIALKKLQGLTLHAFPLEARHTTAARSRKARRLVALRLDVIVRQHQKAGVDQGEYVFAEYGPAGGPFVILSSGPLWRVVGAGQLGQADATTFFDAASATTPIADVDAVLRSIVQAALG